ncbi:complement C1q-like protein 4 [Mya arenaria]|uniref:complement C1q-like protein 4 n=1 Tax=Mya arenaria TaxID=6604 RepID=UPI0022E3A67D|nr:complement C1q-like protein 4 [Mya arenaria]
MGADMLRMQDRLTELENNVAAELSSLKQEVHGNSYSVSPEVKKLKTEQDIKWRFEGNKVQFNFNNELLDAYESNPVASDSEDETKIHRAECRALKKKRSSRGKGRDFANTRQPVQSPFLTGGGRGHFRPYGSFSNASGYGPGSTSVFGYNAVPGFGRPPAPGPCFACGETTHFRRNCPHVRVHEEDINSLPDVLPDRVNLLPDLLRQSRAHTGKCDVQGVAFYAYLSADVCPGAHQILVFDILVTNVGRAYNAHDGAFVVPVNGTYVFAVSLFSQGNKFVCVELVVNGDVKGEVFADSEEINDYHSSSASIVVDVNVGDHVYVRRCADSTCGILSRASRGRTSFSGWFLKY